MPEADVPLAAPALTADVQAAIEALRQRIAQAGQVVFFTGAGMSAESGIPTFRAAQTGLWARFNPQELASQAGYRADTQRGWAWYAARRAQVAAAQPNAGHLALGRFEARHPGKLTVISQNVDDLHQRAGNAATIRLHGDILQDCWLDTCPRRGLGQCQPAFARPGEPPWCADCGNLLRPAVVWFGEELPAAALAAAHAAAQNCDVMVVVGTSGAVWPAGGLAGVARDAGVWVAIVNPEASEIDDVASQVIRGTAATVLPLLLD